MTNSGKGRQTLRVATTLGLILLVALVLVAAVGITLPASAADTGFRTATLSADIPFRDPLHSRDSGRLPDDLWAYADTAQHSGSYYSYGFSIPPGATIDGIAVTVEGHVSAITTRSFDISLSYNGGTNWTAEENIGALTLTDETYTVGGAADKWGYSSWTPTILNSNNFRVRLDVTLGQIGTWIYCDSVQVRVYYRDGTTTVVASSANPSTYGNSVTFTATVTRSSGSNTPSGAVDFQDGGVSMGTGTLTDIGGGQAQATLSISTLDAGTHTITAVYGGDTNFGGSTGTLDGGQIVSQRPITVTADAKSKVYGDADPALTYQITSGRWSAATPSAGPDPRRRRERRHLRHHTGYRWP